MDLRTAATAVGAGLTTALVVAVAIIESVDTEFSAIVGLPLGILAGALVLVLVATRLETAGAPVRLVAAAVAGFGYGVLLGLAAAYVNLISLDAEVTVGVGVAGAILTVLATVLMDGRSSSGRLGGNRQ